MAASILCISAAAAGVGGSEVDGSAGASSWYCQKDAKVNSVAQLCFGDEREQFKEIQRYKKHTNLKIYSIRFIKIFEEIYTLD